MEAGLRGENLGADLSFKKFGAEGLPDLQIAANGKLEAVDEEVPAIVGNGAGKGEMGEGMWQDKEEFEREQEVVQGEIGPRGNGIEGDDREVPSVRKTLTRGDKVERKARKKERRKMLQKEIAGKKKREQESE